MKRVGLLAVLLFSCHSPGVSAKETGVMAEADKLFKAGRYDAALAKYDALVKGGGDERAHTRALFGAIECETMLYRHEQALDRIRAAKLPSDAGLRAIVALTRLEMFAAVSNWYGFPEETEEGAAGSAKLSRAEVERQEESAVEGLWRDREKLARLPLSGYGDFFELANFDAERYPSLWDFATLRLANWLGRKTSGKIDPAKFAVEDFARSFAAALPALERTAALYEESAHLAGGPVDRAVAAERWRVARVGLGASGVATAKQRQAWRDAALERYRSWSERLRTRLGRAAAANEAAKLLYDKRRKEALALVDATLPKTPESDVAVELRSLRHRILEPEIAASARVTRDGKGALTVTSRNLGTLYFRLYAVDPLRDNHGEFWSSVFGSPNYQTVESWITSRRSVASWSVATGDKGDYMETTQKLDVKANGVGLYLAVVAGDADFQTRKSILRAAYVNVTDLAVARAESDAGMRYYAFSADDRAPLASVPFNQIYSSDWQHRSLDVTTTNKEGVGAWKFPNASYLQIDALAIHGKAVATFQAPAYHSRREPAPPLSLFVVTDRPIYRPGQTMKVRVSSVARAKDGSFKVDAGRKLHLVLSDPNGKEVAHADLVSGPMGSVSTEFALPQKGILGAFSLAAVAPGVRNVQQWLGVRVEEYKRPEFEVTLEAPKGASRYGDKTSMKGSVKYYFGGAAGDVPVKWKVSRRRFIPWWYWRPTQSPTVEIARGQLKTDKGGSFSVDFAALPDPDSLPSDDPDFVDVSDFIVEVEAHDAGGRTIAAERSVRVGAQSLFVLAESELGFFYSDERAALKLKAQNLEDQPIAATVSWQLERLAAPKGPLSGLDALPLQAVLKRYSARDANVAHGSLSLDGKGPGALALAALAPGGYRLRMTSGDAHASFAFLVVDRKTGALPDLALPALTLLRKNLLAPGERAELLVGASSSSGAYHLEEWRGDTVVDHRLERGAPVRVWTIPIGEREAGGFSARFIGADGVGIVVGDVDVAVPRKDKLLDVRLVGKPEALEPGQSGKLAVEVKDQKGRPVDGELLATVYDRSLELYASGNAVWGGIWQAPPPPPSSAAGQTEGYGVQLPGDEAAAHAAAREIQGKYKARNVPRFSWERTSYGYGGPGMARGHMMMDAAPAAEMASPPPAPPSSPVGGAEKKVATRRDGDGKSKEDEHTSGEPAPKPKAPPQPGDLRTNMAETAAWIPSLKLVNGKGSFDLVAPERLTSWRVQLYALGRGAEIGLGGDTFATKKPLMVRVEIPRFFREGDRSTVTVVVHNETDKAAGVDVALEIVDDVTGKSRLADLGVKNAKAHVDVAAHGLLPVEFPIVAPENIATYKIRAHVQAGKLADAEERPLPILPSRERLVQSRVVALSGTDKKLIEFAELLKNTDPSLRSESLTVSVDPELALSVLRSIPFLIEYPYECTEQTLNRYVPLAIVNEIYKQHPEIAKAIAAAPHRETEHEPWDKDDPRRMLMLTETPWLRASEGGSRDARLRDLLNPTLVGKMQSTALEKLGRAQNSSGAFTWFPGGKDDFYITLYVLEQLTLLEDFGIAPPRDLASRALAYVARELPSHLRKDELDVAYLAYASYVLTAFDPKRYPEAARARPEVARWMKYVLENRQLLTPYGRAWGARVMARLGDKKLALELLESALDGTRRDPVIGVYFTPERFAWHWYSDSVEKHAFFLRTLAALKPEDDRVPGMLQWLLFNRKGNEWHSTKASAAAVYSILDLMQKQGSLSQPNKFHLSWDKEEEIVTVKPTEDRQKPISWTVRGRDVTPARGKVEIGKEGPGIAFASATWIYSSTKLQEAHASNLIAIERKYFVKVKKQDGDHLVPLASGDKVHVGDEVEVRLTVKSKSQFEYVHIKEPRGAGFEETTLTSGWRWSEVSAYEEPRDSLFNFFVDWLPHGEFTLRHSLRPTTPGTYRIGSAVLQSMYSPDVTTFSGGMELQVVR